LGLPPQGDVRRFEDCQRMVGEAVAKFARLDILVNCAGGRDGVVGFHLVFAS
jgi:NAD(P)-dependent dehydrogenase (short-subunit alcohol dehydrogenase family)